MIITNSAKVQRLTILVSVQGLKGHLLHLANGSNGTLEDATILDLADNKAIGLNSSGNLGQNNLGAIGDWGRGRCGRLTMVRLCRGTAGRSGRARAI